jgi:DNA-binding GntR family transcriptional regulator
VHLKRLRLAEGIPLAIMDNMIPVKVLAEPLEAEALEREGLYQLLRAQGIRLQSAHEVIAARTATAHEARLLEANRHATVLTMARTAKDAAGTVIEFGRHCYLASLYSFEIDLWLK